MPVRRSRKGKQGSGAKQAAITAANAVTANAQLQVLTTATSIGRAQTTTTIPTPQIASNNLVVCTNVDNDDNNNNKHHHLILTSEKRRGVYECDYCGCDVSQTPRIRCAICVDFDVCCDCFITTDPMTAMARLQTAQHALALQQQQQQSLSEWDGPDTSSSSTTLMVPPPPHDPLTHGYRVCDSTRYPLFPINAAVMAGIAAANNQNASTSITGMTNNNNHSFMASSRKKKIKTMESGTLYDEVNVEPLEDNNTMEGVEVYEKCENQDTSKILGNEVNSDDTVKPTTDGINTTNNNNTTTTTTTTTATIEPIVMSAGDDNKTIWTIEEDLRLLCAIQTHGLGNWTEISEAIVGHGSSGKTPKRCMERYFDDYMGRYGYILPPYTLISEATTTTTNNNNNNTSTTTASTTTNIPNHPTDIDDDTETTTTTATTSNVGAADPNKDSSTMSTPGPTMTTEFTVRSSKRRSTMLRTPGGTSTLPVTKKYMAVPTESLPEYQYIQLKPFLPKLDVGSVTIGQEVGRDLATKAELAYVRTISGLESKEQVDRIRKDWEINRLNKPGGPTVLPMRPDDIPKLPGSEISGYMPRRGDFDIEYENNAEDAIADMEFLPGESEQDRNLKLAVLAIYHSKLMERNKRKQFIISRKLYDYKSYQEEYRKLPRDERDLVLRMRLFERFHTPEEHKIFIADILKAKRLRKEIAKLQMYRRMGIRTQLEAERYEIDKARRLFHKNAVAQNNDAISQADLALSSGVVAAGTTSGTLMKASSSLSSSNDQESISSQYWKQYRTTDRKVRRSVNRGISDETNTAQPQLSNMAMEKSEENVLTYSTNNQTSLQILSPNIDNDVTMKEKAADIGDAMEVDNPKTDKVKTIENTEKDEGLQLENETVKNDIRNVDDTQLPGYHQLSPREVDLIRSIQISPLQYIQIKKALIYESLQHGLLNTNDVDESKNNHEDDNNDGRRIRRTMSGGTTSTTTTSMNMNSTSTSSTNNHIHTLFLLDIERRGMIIDFILHAGWITTQYGKSVQMMSHH